MGPLDLLIHLLNFLAPALCVAGLVTLSTRLCLRKGAAAPAGCFPFAVNFAVGAAVSLAGLVLFGRDGKMVSYAALVLAVASSQWWLRGGWRK